VLGEDEQKVVAEEFRKVLNAVIDNRRRELKGYEDGKVEYLGNEKDTFETLVKLYRVANETEIKVESIKDKGKTKINVKITYPVAKIGKRILESEEKKIGV
jgi:hypothetical protein